MKLRRRAKGWGSNTKPLLCRPYYFRHAGSFYWEAPLKTPSRCGALWLPQVALLFTLYENFGRAIDRLV